MKNDKIFPNHWKEIIQGKKVIFYNTSVSNMLNGREKHLEKIKWVFHFFKKHPEVVLWWRPHPLELSTIQSMLPDLEEPYKDMRRQYQEECIGILDESADLNRAIAISDAYYGDWSSVVHLYRATGKPVLFENDNIYENLRENQLEVIDFIYDKGKIWYISAVYNYLFEIDLEKKIVEKMVRLPIGYPFSGFTIKYFFHVDDEIILVPGKRNKILKYNITTEKITFITVRDNILSLFVCVYYENNHTVYGVTGNDNFVYEYNLLTDSYHRKAIGAKENCYIGINRAGSKFILTQSLNEKIILWNKDDDEIEEIGDFPQEYEVIYPSLPFTDIVLCNETIILFPKYANLILNIDLEEKKIVRGSDNYIPYSYDNGMVYSCAKNIGDTIIAYAQYTNTWVKYHYDSRTIEELKINMSEEQWDYLHHNNLFDKKDSEEESFYEGENQYFFTLARYINDIQHWVESGTNNNEKQCGYKIYAYVQGELS